MIATPSEVSKTKPGVIVLWCAIVAVVLAGIWFLLTLQPASSFLRNDGNPNLVNAAGMKFEVVTSIPGQNKGLGDRPVVPDNYAMLFVFPQDEEPGFWMKDMLTSIDMIWLTSDGTIVAIDPSVSPDTYPSVFYPPQPIRYVLETKAGFAAEKGWKIGTKVLLPVPYGP